MRRKPPSRQRPRSLRPLYPSRPALPPQRPPLRRQRPPPRPRARRPVVETFQGSYGDLNKKIRAAIQGGGVPDVAMAYEPETQEYQTAGTIVPIDDYLASSKYGISDAAIKDLMPNVLARQRIKQYGGKTLSWPHGTSSQGVYYNVDLLKKAGFERPTASLADFAAQAKTIKEKTGVITFPYGTMMGGTWLNFLRSYGVNFVTDDGKTSNFEKPEALLALKLLKQMKDDGTAAVVQDTEQEFTNQRAAMEISTTARTSSKIDLIGTKFNWGITLPPQGKADIKVTQMYGGNQVLFKSNPKKQLAGWLFMRYFAGTDAQAIYGQKTGYFPATISSQNTELLKKDYTDHPQNVGLPATTDGRASPSSLPERKGAFRAMTKESAMPIMRDRIAACTIAYPDLDLAEAARLQSETFRAVEVTFDYGISLPLREGVIADLAAVQRERELHYAVHLPLSIQFASPNPLLRDASIRTVVETIDACGPLTVSAWVLHVTPFHSIERPIVSRERAAAQRDVAVVNATNSVRELLDRTGIPSRSLAVENLGFPFGYIEALLEACDTGICCDIGHLLAAGVDPVPFIERYAPRICHIHLHD
ncbi:MAG: extracellular solute-binding protein, partial [Thermomicrobia bacterium]|nr:extracellular solute-binding protein [Thermomicrobia bacterium]